MTPPLEKPSADRIIQPAKHTATISKQAVFVGFLMLILVAAVIFGGVIIVQLKANLDSTVQRVYTLEQQLYNADESKNKSVAALQAVQNKNSEQIKVNLSEIRKLWHIAHQRNSKDIKNLQSLIKSVQANIDELNASFDALSALVNQLNKKQIERLATAEKSMNTLNRNLTNLQSAYDNTSQEVVLNLASIDEIQANTRDQFNTIIKLEKLARNNTRANQDFTDEIAEMKEQIMAINNHRRIINRDLKQLKEQAGNADNRSEAQNALQGRPQQ